MALHRSETKVVALPIQFIRDNNLSLSARGLLSFLLSHTEKYEIDEDDEIIRPLLEELMLHGYIYKEEGSDIFNVRGEK